MYVLSCHIEIQAQNGKLLTYDYVSEVIVQTSLTDFTDTCILTLPRKVQFKGKNITSYIKKNDKITVNLGYDNNLKTVFKGYVKTVQTGKPTVLECENESYNLKQIKIKPKHYPTVTLAKLIKEYLPAYTTEVSDINLGELRIAEEISLAKLFDWLSQNYPIRFYFRETVFYAGLPTALLARDQKTIVFKQGLNMISDNLNYTLAEDVNLQIVAKCILKNNQKLEHTEPKKADSAEIRTFYVPGAKSKSDLETYAKEKLKEFKTDKMDGTFTAFGHPHVRKGDVVLLFDDDNTERDNKRFLAEAVRYTFGQSGYRQEITLGQELK